LVAGVGGTIVGVACGAVLVLTMPYAHQAARINIPPRHTKKMARARPDWEGDVFGELERGFFMWRRSYLIIYL
jgi:hypothetical protein